MSFIYGFIDVIRYNVRVVREKAYCPHIYTDNIMKNIFEVIASSTRFIRLQRNVDQESAANEAGVSLRTIQNIEAGKAVNSSSLFAYLSYLDLLDNMLATLPAPAKLTPIELLKSTPERRARARGVIKKRAVSTPTRNTENNLIKDEAGFQWGDEK